MRGSEVRWYRFGKPDKKRPVLLLTRNSALQFLHEVTVAPITSTVREMPTEVLLDESDGMPGRCAVNLDHVQTVAKAKLGALITTLDAETMREAARSLSFALALDD